MDSDLAVTREFHWKIIDFTNFYDVVEKTVWNKNFSIFFDNSETKWCFEIRIENSQIGIYLRYLEAEIDGFVVKFEIFVRTPKFLVIKNKKLTDTRSSNDYKTNKIYGWNNLLSKGDIWKRHKGYIDDGTIILELKVVLTKKRELDVQNSNSQNHYLTMCKEYFTSKTFADITFICSDMIEIPAHRFILGGASSVFKTILQIRMAETKITEIRVNDIDGETMTEILRFIYTHEVINGNKLAVKLLYGAEKYELDELKKLCSSLMVENLSVDNALEYFLLGDRYKSKALLVGSAIFIKSNYDVLRKKNWSNFSNNQFLLLLDNYQHNTDSITVFESTF
ncbi:protein roadkill-like [Chironomus tepperi]|uniref:protein roadkill-like n=1 Tax=Chironomus tepperi TaxID=113505 RepID=UPI00391F3275